MSLLSLLGLFACGSGYKDLGTEEFAKAIDDGSIALIDVRTPEEYAAGHLHGAANVDWKSADFMDRMSAFPKETPLAVYCRSGRRSAEAAAKLSKAGYTVINMLGGYLAWTEENRPVTQSPVETFFTDSGKQQILSGMIDEKILSELRGRDVVLFVATEGEVDESASPFPVVITGYGKMRMYAALVRWYESLEAGRHPIVLNIGSAGSAKYPIGEVINVGSFINGGDDFVHDRIDAPREGASVYSGDFFMSTKTFSPEEVKRLSSEYDLFDMEAYAVAYFCSSYGIPYYCFKAVSDNLDGSVKDWKNILGEIKATFSQLLECLR